ncbi:MAG: MBL fold metallo-hydrolase [Mycoplasma sp.]
MKNIFNDLVVFNTNQLANNTYVLINNNHCVIIDPSTYELELVQYITKHNLIVDGIVLTHGHYDHIMSAFNVAKYFEVKIYAHKQEEKVITKYSCARELFGVNPNIHNELVVYLDQNEWTIGNFKFSVIHTPGHTCGCVCLTYKNYVFTGDTLFIEDIGRTDLPTGDQEQMNQSLALIKKTIKDDQYILCGHNDKYVQFKQVKQINTFLR